MASMTPWDISYPMVKAYKNAVFPEKWCQMAQVEIKDIDEQGRIIIPKAWRRKHLKSNRVILKLKEGAIEIVPYSALDLTKFFDKMEVDIKSDLGDWHALRRELRAL